METFNNEEEEGDKNDAEEMAKLERKKSKWKRICTRKKKKSCK